MSDYADLCEKWRAMYDERRAEANRLWEVLHKLSGDLRVPQEVRAAILLELSK